MVRLLYYCLFVCLGNYEFSPHTVYPHTVTENAAAPKGKALSDEICR